MTGAQSLAAHGIEVSKLRILARHSGDSILRYVAEAPLRALRTDLGLVNAASSSKCEVRAAQVPADLVARLDSALNQIEQQGKLIEAIQVNISTTRATCYVQNVNTGVIHAMRAGDAQRTSCGWAVVTNNRGVHEAKRCKWLSTVQGEPWKKMCSTCMQLERNAAKMLVGAPDSGQRFQVAT